MTIQIPGIDERFSRLEQQMAEIHKLLSSYSNSNSSQPDIINIKEASTVLDLAVPTIYGMVSRAEIPFIKRKGSKRLYFSRKALQEWLMEGSQRTLSDQKKDVNLDLMRRGGRRKAV